MKISVSSYSFSQYITKGKLTQFSAIEAAHKIGLENIEFTDLMPPEGVTKEEYAHQLREEADRLGMGITCYAIGACMACDTEEENRAGETDGFLQQIFHALVGTCCGGNPAAAETGRCGCLHAA